MTAQVIFKKMEAKKTMPEAEAESYTEHVQSWWNKHPFTLGLGSSAERDLTGPVGEIDRHFFDEVERKMRKWWIGATHESGEPLLSKFVPYRELAGKKVLDIAIGTGWSTIAFAEHGAEVWGIDLTEEAIRMSRRHAELKGFTPHLAQMDAQALTFADATFDFVLAWGCHMHMPDTERSLREVRRVLKPGCATVAYWYNRSSWTYWFNFVFLRGILGGKLFAYRFNTTRLVSRYTDGSAIGGNALTKVYSPAELVRMYRAAGFSSVKVETMPLKGEVEGWPMAKFPVFRYLPQFIRNWMGKRWAWGLVVTAVA